MSKVTIRSATFPSCYLRVDGTGLDANSKKIGGKVNCRGSASQSEILLLENLDNKTPNVFAIRSNAFANVYLRMDASGVHKFEKPGSGVVNCQYGLGPETKFSFEKQPDGSTAIASVKWPGVYIRMDGRNSKKPPQDFGTANCQPKVGPFEKFFISDVIKPLTRAEVEKAIKDYGPILQLHPQEQYCNTSVEYFLQHSTLVDGTDSSRSIVHPSVDQLPRSGTPKQYYLTLEEAGKAGDFNLAKAYVHAFWQQGMPYTELQFWLFSAYNGHGSAQVKGLNFDSVANEAAVNLEPLGEHVGDWECVMIRVDNSSKELVGIWLSQHSGGQLFTQEQASKSFKWRGKQPYVYSSLNGHANYSQPGPNYTHHIKLGGFPLPFGIDFALLNSCADGGKSLDCSQKYEVISADWLTGADAYPAPKWLAYPFRWGPEGTSTKMNANDVSEVLNAAAGPQLGAALSGTLPAILAAEILPHFVKGDINGPTPPNTKTTWQGQYSEDRGL